MALVGLGARTSFNPNRPKPRVAATPAPASAPTPAPAVPAMPVDPIYDETVNATTLNYAQTLQRAQYARGQLGSEFGIGVTPQGSVYDDHSNPFSRAAVMQLAYDRQRAGNTNSYAARGQLYAGSLQDAQNEGARSHLQNRDALLRQFNASQKAIADSEINATNLSLEQLAQAKAARAARALANRPDDASVR